MQYELDFDNGYGVSVIDYGYGSHQGLLEMAVIHDDRLCYSTPITSDVIGHLTPSATIKQHGKERCDVRTSRR